jgi:hypothetical protein
MFNSIERGTGLHTRSIQVQNSNLWNSQSLQSRAYPQIRGLGPLQRSIDVFSLRGLQRQKDLHPKGYTERGALDLHLFQDSFDGTAAASTFNEEKPLNTDRKTSAVVPPSPFASTNTHGFDRGTDNVKESGMSNRGPVENLQHFK